MIIKKIRMRKLFTLLFISFFLFSTLQAQDIHFTQFWATPLNYSPAQAGNIDGTYRAGVIYRSQWASFSPYKTFSASYDMNFSKGLAIGDQTAAGIVFYHDNSGDANFKSTFFMLNGAYHKALGIDKRLSIGLQLGYGQKGIDQSELKFGSSYNPSADEFDIPSGEAVTENISHVDLNAGVEFSTLITSTTSANIGIGAFHLTGPTEDFINTGLQEKLARRYTANIGVNHQLTETIVISPKVVYNYQAKAQEIFFGANVGYDLQNENFPATLYGGAWYRWNDAIAPYVGLGYKDFRLGLSYDIYTNSDLTSAFEISLIYIGKITPAPTTIVVPCIRF